MERIQLLEDQVKGLMETVNQLHGVLRLQRWKVSPPDRYVRTGGDATSDVQRCMPATVPSSAGTNLASVAMIEPSTASAAHSSPAPVTRVELKKPTGPEEKSVSISEVFNITPYQYSPLNPKSSEIRILALQASSSPTEPITCRLVTASLDDDHTRGYPIKPSITQLFTPLSYCWGTAGMTEKIVVDGHFLAVTPSLYRALSHFRKVNRNLPDRLKRHQSAGETFWWIDAICVNQKDLDERSSQVGLMTRLYRQAPMVHVWLGEESDDSARAIQVVREIAYLPTSYEDRASWEFIPKPGQTHRPTGPGLPRVKLLEEPPAISTDEKAKNYCALINLYQRPWFSRIWIRQEVALPKQIEFHCGKESCSWVAIMRTADTLTYLADQHHLQDLRRPDIRANSTFMSCFRKVIELSNFRCKQGDGYQYLSPLLFDSRDCQATDPRDKVYAMLPLTNPDETDIVADYRKDYRNLYKTVALSLVTSGLKYLAGCQNPSCSNGMPSWVPNLEAPWKLFPVDWEPFHDTSLEQHYGHPPVETPQVTYLPEHSQLDVEGVIFDEIQAINHEHYVDAEMSYPEVCAIVRKWWRFWTYRREQLLELWDLDERLHSDNMVSSFLKEEDWESLILRDNSSKAYSGGVTLFEPMKDRPIDMDPTFRRVKSLLLPDSTSYADRIREERMISNFRALASGRRMMITARGFHGLVPADAQPRDRLCFFTGSSNPFIIRNTVDERWVIVGNACELYLSLESTLANQVLVFFGRIVLPDLHPKLEKTTIRLI